MTRTELAKRLAVEALDAFPVEDGFEVRVLPFGFGLVKVGVRRDSRFVEGCVTPDAAADSVFDLAKFYVRELRANWDGA